MSDEVLQSCLQTLKGVFVFGGDIVQADGGVHEGWRSLRGIEEDKTGGMPSYERVEAAVVLWRMNPKLVIVPSGGVTNVEGVTSGPSIGAVMATELRSLGVAQQSIVEETTAFNTQEQIVACARIARQKNWAAHEIAISSLFFHAGRITAMISAADTRDVAPFVPGETAFLSTERALAADDPEKWNAYFSDLYARPEMAATIMGEALGTGQLWSGHHPRFPRPFKGFKDPLGS